MIAQLKENTYWVLMALGAIAVVVGVLKRRNRFNLNCCQSIAFAILAVAVAFLGAKILYALENWNDLQLVVRSMSGLSLFGSVYIIPILIPVIGKLFHLRSWQSLDICAPCAALMLGIVRAGCHLNGCCGGYLVHFGDISFYWPTQFMESLGAFAILGILLQMEEDAKYRGVLYPVFMFSYGILRFLVEFLRDTQKNWLFLGHGQWFALVAILVAYLWIKHMKVKGYEE